jgi:tetratricopeptide (TPR) repeat protein
MSTGPRPDALPVFVCYAHKDNDSADASKRWLDRLLEQLEPLGLQGQVSAWSDQQLEAGDFWDAAIQKQLQQAKAAVLLVSPAFLASKYIRNSELPVLLMKARQQGAVILPIILRHCLFNETLFKYPDPIDGPQQLSLAALQTANASTEPLNALQEHEQDQVLLAVAQRLLKLVEAGEPASTQSNDAAVPLHNLPFRRNEFFTGREQVLSDLRAALTTKRAAALTQTQAISGMGGIGKTQTALEYAYRYGEHYQAIFWVKADSHLALTSGFMEIAALLNLPEKDAQEADLAIRAVLAWLEHHSGWLLIFDNADAPELLKPFRPRTATGHVLLTSRAQLFDMIGIGKPLELETMTPDEALRFLFTRTARAEPSQTEKTAAQDLAAELGYLPLALEQAAAFILAKQARFQDYLVSYGKQRLKLLQQARPVAGEYPESVATTWALNFQEVEQASQAAADLLTLSAFLSPDRIPFEVISKGRQQLGPAIEQTLAEIDDDPLLLNQLLAPLTLYSLVRLDADQQTYSLHRLVQEVVQQRLDEPTRRLWAERTVEALNEAFPYVEFKNWAVCERLMPHAKQAARLVQQWQVVSQSAARLLNQGGFYFSERGQYTDAAPLYQQALAIRQQSLGTDHPDVASSLNNLAMLYQDQNSFAEAEPLLQQALAIRQQAFDADHPDIAQSLNNLALLYYQQSKLADAESLLRQALAIWEKALGPDHPNVATSLNNLAGLYRQQGKFAEAEPLFQQALAIDEKALGPDHPDLATDLNNLALLYKQQGKLADAEPLCQQALVILENALGPQHPRLATCLKNYASLLRALHRDNEADQLDARAEAIRKPT